ncbi:hypothetical protein MTR67_038385, partial [Solanum verrucosum]
QGVYHMKQPHPYPQDHVEEEEEVDIEIEDEDKAKPELRANVGFTGLPSMDVGVVQQVLAFLSGLLEAKALELVITCTILVCDRMATVLFDPGSEFEVERWIDLTKVYDVTIHYHSGKANMVVDALSRKTISMDTLNCLGVSKRPLAKEIWILEYKFMRLGISQTGGVLVSIEVKPSFIERIKVKKFWDKELVNFKIKVVFGETQDATLDAYGWFKAKDVKPLGVGLVKDAQERVREIQAKLLAAKSRQKEYVDRMVRDITFQVGD